VFHFFISVSTPWTGCSGDNAHSGGDVVGIEVGELLLGDRLKLVIAELGNLSF
jgi:hypothetical protein